MAWLTNWNYRKAVTISNSGSSLTDYQVLITIDTASLVTAGKLLSSCDDIRFTSSDGSTVLNYWIESGCNTSTTNVWVKVPSIANGSNTIYFYYGYSSATVASNGPNTYDLFDDFDDGNYNGWTVASGSWFATSNYLQTSTDQSKIYIAHSRGNSGVWEFRHRSVDGTSGLFWLINFAATATTPQSGYSLYYNTGTLQLRRDTSVLASGSGLSYDTNWHNVKITRNSSGLFKVYIDSVEKISYTDTTYNSFTYFNLWQQGVSRQVNIDDIHVRKFASPEPTFSSLGTEETESLPANITATNMVITPSETPCRAGICTLSVDVTWTNTGGTSGTFVPNITIDTVAIDPPPYSSESLGAGASVTKSFTVTNLSSGNPAICPYPN